MNTGVSTLLHKHKFMSYGFTGAMENWGLVTYRESALLVDPKKSSAKTKQWVALVVGHELAHQWFGNLVTMVRYFQLTLPHRLGCPY